MSKDPRMRCSYREIIWTPGMIHTIVVGVVVWERGNPENRGAASLTTEETKPIREAMQTLGYTGWDDEFFSMFLDRAKQCSIPEMDTHGYNKCGGTGIHFGPEKALVSGLPVQDRAELYVQQLIKGDSNV